MPSRSFRRLVRGQSEPADPPLFALPALGGDAGLAGEAGLRGLGALAGEFGLAGLRGLGALAGEFGLAGLRGLGALAGELGLAGDAEDTELELEPTLAGAGADMTVTDESVTRRFRGPRSMTAPSLLVTGPPGTIVLSVEVRFIEVAAAAAPLARMPSPTAPVTP